MRIKIVLLPYVVVDYIHIDVNIYAQTTYIANVVIFKHKQQQNRTHADVDCMSTLVKNQFVNTRKISV